MNKFFKITAQIVGFLIILYILLMIFLYIFVQTKDFKPIVEKTFYEKTGHTLNIAGDIKLSIFPWPSIKASNFIINNPKNFYAPKNRNYLAKIGKAQVTISIYNLFHGDIDPKNVLISNIIVNLITDQSGKTNWENLLKFKLNNTHSNVTHVNTSKNNNSMAKIANFPVVEISNANIHFINLQTKQRTDITDLQLRTPVSRVPSQRLITLSCYVKHTNPNTYLHILAKANMHLTSSLSQIDFRKLHFGIEWIQVKNKFKHPIALLLDGKISISNDDFKSQFLGNFSQNKGSIDLSVNRQNRLISASTTLNNLDVTPLAEILFGKRWIYGTLNATTLLNTEGKTFHDWLRHLSGQGSLKITKGKFYGLNMALLVSKTLTSLLSSTTNPQPASNNEMATKFASLSADFRVVNGIARTSNFLLTAEQVKATGKGSVDLPNATIDAKLLTTYANNPQWQLPLEITGSLSNPKVQPDTMAIAQKVLKKKLQKDVGNTLDKVKKQFDKLFE